MPRVWSQVFNWLSIGSLFWQSKYKTILVKLLEEISEKVKISSLITRDPAFDWKNIVAVISLLFSFCMKKGMGYRVLQINFVLSYARHVQNGTFSWKWNPIPESAFHKVLLGHEFWLLFSPLPHSRSAYHGGWEGGSAEFHLESLNVIYGDSGGSHTEDLL